jgi:hypothetical protein
VRVSGYKEAVRLARCAGEDTANRRMRKAGRKAWSISDSEHATRVTVRLLEDLGFDISGWVAMAGVQRNEPVEPPVRKKAQRRAQQAPVQLSFAFQ